MITRALATVLLALSVQLSLAQSPADEARDWGVPPQTSLRPAPYTAPTPLAVPGARTVLAAQLQRSLASPGGPLLIDVASGEGHVTLAGALWWPGMGRGANFIDAIQGEFADRLATATSGDKARPLAFFCVNAQCWLSYNASLRAVALGYTNVLWYRGGVEAWRDAGLPLGRVSIPWGRAAPLDTSGGNQAPR